MVQLGLMRIMYQLLLFLVTEQRRAGEDGEKLLEASKTTGLSSGIAPNSGKSFEASFSSMNALIESCVKFSEASASASPGDDIGMNLLASVAAGEISKSDIVSPLGSGRNSPVAEDSCSGNDAKLRQLDEDIACTQGQRNDGAHCGATTEQGNTVDSLQVKNGLQHPPTPVSTNFAGSSKVTLFGSEEKTGESCVQLNSFSTDLQRNAEDPCLTPDTKHGELAYDASMAVSSVDAMKDGNTENEGANWFHEQRKSGALREGSDNVSDSILKVRSPFLDEDKKGDGADEKIVENCIAAVSEAAATSEKVKMEAREESPCSTSDMVGEGKNSVHKESSSGTLVEQKPLLTVKSRVESIEGKSEEAVLVSGSGNVLGMESKAVKAEKADDVKPGNHVGQREKQRNDSGSSISEDDRECAEDNSDRKEIRGHHSSGSAWHEESSAISAQETEQCMKSSEHKLVKAEADGSEERHASAANASTSAAGSDMVVKLDFDLNEGFPVDDENQGELVISPVPGSSSAVHLSCPLPFPISSMSGSLPASITVAAAAKGPFVPPENLLRTKGELGWKGSAATSAFRPAEPRKVLEMPLNTIDIPFVDATASKQGRPPLDIDLNVTDERVLEDVASHNPARMACSESGPRDRSGGGLDLDLNRVDESPDMQLSVSNGIRLENPSLPGGSSLSGGHSNGEVNGSRDFDLNNGPSLDEVGTEAAPRNQHAKSNVSFLSPIPCVRMNSNMDGGNLSSWFPPGNSYPAITIPSILPGRGEQSYPIVTAAGSQRILGSAGSSASFGPEMYRGPVLSSSPAVAFPSTTPFQYPGFPFETSFPLSSNSFSGCSTGYVDSSSGGAPGFHAIPSQLVGPASVVPSHYPRPYVMGFPGGTSNVGPESRKWGGQGLDLNAGPGGSDIERRDDRLPSALRQLPVAGSQAPADEQLKMYQVPSGVLKRREPDGGWDAADRFYKQPSWQ
ncbi:hypothetical protein L1049_002896 [Liquidambar formosana]|uniref:Uncharacterized protein n=1 Tax=Liquidambar formosana TaxID=63359 RepID=A0AAP0NGI3_LIQFO